MKSVNHISQASHMSLCNGNYDHYYPPTNSSTDSIEQAHPTLINPSYHYHGYDEGNAYANGHDGPVFTYSCLEYGTQELCVNETMIDLCSYKVNKCCNATSHYYKLCDNYHSQKDRRRYPITYSTDKCPYFDTDQCPNYETCPYSHNRLEKFYHPEKYKTRMCDMYCKEGGGFCKYQRICSFAHSIIELTIFPIHCLPLNEMYYIYYFKTAWCPFTDNHNRASCPYAHNWQDFRRRPHLFQYTNEMCPYWSHSNFLCNYKDGCPSKAACRYSHGWKEKLFHPMEYKTNACPYGKKCKMADKLSCPYFHSEIEKSTKIYQKPCSKLELLNPYNNINDQVEEVYDPMFGTNINYLALHYTAFEEETPYCKSCKDYAPSSKCKMESTSLPIIRQESDQSLRNSKFVGKIEVNDYSEALYNILNKVELLEFYFALKDNMYVSDVNYLKNLTDSKLFELGITEKGKRDKLLWAIAVSQGH